MLGFIQALCQHVGTFPRLCLCTQIPGAESVQVICPLLCVPVSMSVCVQISVCLCSPRLCVCGDPASLQYSPPFTGAVPGTMSCSICRRIAWDALTHSLQPWQAASVSLLLL